MLSPQPQHSGEEDWSWFPTINTEELIFGLFVDTQKITLSNKPKREILANGAVPYSAPTKFKDLAPEFAAPHLDSLGISEWEFIGQNISQPRSTFYFFKNKTAVEMNVPYYVNDEIGNHPWPMVILDVWVDTLDWPQNAFVPDGNQRNLVYEPTRVIQDLRLPPISEGSTIIERRFLTARQPKTQVPKVPMPMPMRILLPTGEHREYDEVLHDEILVRDGRNSRTPFVIVTTAGVTTQTARGVQFFEATNFTGRKAYVFRDSAEQNAFGLWERRQLEARPPHAKPVIL